MKEFMSNRNLAGVGASNPFEDEARAWAKNMTQGMQGLLAAAYLAGASEGNVEVRHQLAEMAQRNDELHAKLSAQEGGYKSLKAQYENALRRIEEMAGDNNDVLRLERENELLREKLAKREAKKAKVTP
jgi:hypothetical protein